MESKPSIRTKIREFLLLRTLHSKLILIYLIFSIGLFIFINLAVMSVVTNLEETMMLRRLHSDVIYLEDLLSKDDSARWKIENDKIYYGNLLIGDGTEQNANLAPFFELERKTGTFSYVFILDEDAELSYVKATASSAGYAEGHYLRVAGSTKSPEGESIVGTYIAKNVADALDKNWIYSGEAVVAGRRIYCLYNALFDVQGNIVGAIVVGRNITELQAQIKSSVNKISYATLFAIIISGFFMALITLKWTSAIKIIVRYLKQIESGNLPEKPLKLNTRDEMSLIADSINQMLISLEENTSLRKKSETDALTNLPNRAAFYTYTQSLYGKLLETPQTFALEILDIDFFKQYNDNYGHSAGDTCLQMVAGEMRAIAAESEDIFPCRYGGDEFVIIYTGYSKSEIHDMVATLKGRVLSCNIEHEFSKISDVVTVTQGVCFGLFDGSSSIEDYFEKADQALYEVKKVTRNDFNIVSIDDENIQHIVKVR